MNKKLDTAPDLSPERRANVRREMIRWIATNFDAHRKPVTHKHYLMNTTSIRAIAQHNKAHNYGAA